jgi:hypothetical protein
VRTDGNQPKAFDHFSIATVRPQFVVGKYRVDFEVGIHITLWPGYPGDPPKGRERDHTWHRATVLVECDGHDYHERTKEQASHDKAKDRALQSAGFTIFRYTGADVWRDCMLAAEEVFNMAMRKAKESPEVESWTRPPRYWPSLMKG